MDTVAFLETLYRGIPHGYMEMRLIHEAKHFIKRLWKPLPMVDLNPQGIAKLHDLNTEYHIYHRVAVSMGRASEKRDIAMLPAIWLDIDDCSQSAYDRLLGMDMYPNIIVHSGGGFHAYWLLKYPVTTDSEKAWFEIERTMHGMILAFGGQADRVTRDITRILRTPGFVNIKAKYGDNKPVARVVFSDDSRYRFDLLHEMFAPLGAPPQPKVTRYIPTEALTRNLPNRVKNYLQYGVSTHRNNELYYCARAYLDNGYSQMEASNDLSPRARADGLPDNQIAATIASAFRNSPSPTASLPAHMRTFMAIEDMAGGES